jgi:2-haloacid dehalogenase
MRIDLIAFDLNGTLLDMSALDPHFARAFGSAGLREKWFEELQALWMTASMTGRYKPFDKLAKAAIEMLAVREAVPLKVTEETALLETMKQLPAYPEVPDALVRLRASGRPIVALTNGTMSSARAQLAHASIAHLFDGVFSADEIRRYKPAPEAYLQVLRAIGVEPTHALLVAAHAWDISGAQAVGMRTAFVQRPRQSLSPLGKKPDLSVVDLHALANKLDALNER